MVQNPRTQFGGARRVHSRSMSTRQWAALIGGGALAIYGITRRSPLGAALAASGGTLAVLGTKRSGDHSSTWTSLLINSTPQELYRFWRDFQNLPRIMNRLQHVTVLDDKRSTWVATGPSGQTVKWETEIVEDRENEFIAWRSLPGSDVQVDGHVGFQEARAGRGTMMTAHLKFGAGSSMHSALAKFFNKGANFAIRQDLRRFEALLETGEIPTTEGQPHGPRDAVTGLMRVADPTRPIPPESSLNAEFAARRRSA